MIARSPSTSKSKYHRLNRTRPPPMHQGVIVSDECDVLCSKGLHLTPRIRLTCANGMKRFRCRIGWNGRAASWSRSSRKGADSSRPAPMEEQQADDDPNQDDRQ